MSLNLSRRQQQRLIIAVIVLSLLPTIGVMGWGVLQATKAAEFIHPLW